MTCYHPYNVYPGGNVNKVTKAPCGKCIGCTLEYSRQWAIRCVHESMMHDENCFITLTYNNENLPRDNGVHKDEVQKFMKNLRREVNPKLVRYYAAGEYGDRFNRPHYHICLFGHDFKDKEILEITKRGRLSNRFSTRQMCTLYTSKELGKLWKKGFHSIGKLNFETAAYAARYVTKKRFVSDSSYDSYVAFNRKYKGRNVEFALMSRMPGLARSWIEKYMTDVYPKGYFTINGIKMRTIRYYDKVFQRYCADNDEFGMYEEYEKMKAKRKAKDKNESPKRLMEREYHKKITIKRHLNRRLENE